MIILNVSMSDWTLSYIKNYEVSFEHSTWKAFDDGENIQYVAVDIQNLFFTM